MICKNCNGEGLVLKKICEVCKGTGKVGELSDLNEVTTMEEEKVEVEETPIVESENFSEGSGEEVEGETPVSEGTPE